MIYPKHHSHPMDDLDSWPEPYPERGFMDRGWSSLHGLAGGADWQQVQEEVSHETTGQIALTGAPDSGKRALLRALRGRAGAIAGEAPVIHDGFFLIVDLPSHADPEVQDDLLVRMQMVDLILYLINGENGLRSEDISWISLLRSRGVKIVGALSKAESLPNPHQAAQEIGDSLALRLTPILLEEGHEYGLRTLIEHMLKARPDLSIPLAREAPLARPMVTERIIRQSALTAAILGASPAPLLDLPLQVSNHMRMALRIGAAHGQPGADYLSREMMAAVGASVGLRYLIQQIIRLVPVIGWAANAAIQAASTYLLGHTLARYYAANWDAMSNQELLNAANPWPKMARIKAFNHIKRPKRPRSLKGVKLPRPQWHLLRHRSNGHRRR